MSAVRESLGDLRENLRRSLERTKEDINSVLLVGLMFWWTVAAIEVPGPRPSQAAAGDQSPEVLKFMELGCWAFPLGLWWSVLRLAFSASPTMALEEPQKTRLLVSICFCLLIVCALGTSASGLGPGLRAEGAQLARLNFAAVLSPVVPLLVMKAEQRWLWHLWPPSDQILDVQAHLPWMAVIFAITLSNLLMVGFMSLSRQLSLLLVELLPATPDAQRARLEKAMRQPDPIDGLLLATHVLSSIFATLHLPTVLRSLCLPLQLDQPLVNSWERLGAIVIFIAAGDGLWLAIYGSPWCIYIVQFWCFCFLYLCRKLGASPWASAWRIAVCPLARWRSAWRLQILRDALRSGEVTFTNRPLLQVEPGEEIC